MSVKNLYLSIFVIIMFIAESAGAENLSPRIVNNISAEGSCAVVGMSAEQARLMALQRARVAAIEEASGIKVTSSTLVTNARLAANFMRTYSKGYIVSEKVEWLPIEQYQKNPSTPPVPEYRVKIRADVYKPERRITLLGLESEINESIFRNGEEGRIKITTERKAKIAIFNITAEDNVVMLFPNQFEKDNVIAGRKTFVFPANNSPIALTFRTLEGHKRDAEAIFVTAMDESHNRKFINMFKPLEPMGFSEFFAKYSEIADYCEDKLLTYEVSE